jgi:hypothetical protein
MTPSVASQGVIPKVSIYFISNSVWKLLDRPLYSWCLLFAAVISTRIGSIENDHTTKGSSLPLQGNTVHHHTSVLFPPALEHAVCAVK